MHTVSRVVGEVAPLVLVLLVGPPASGKSSIARALAEGMRRDGERVALVARDQIADMARPMPPGGDSVARVFAVVAGEWARADLTCVVAEGIASRHEVSMVLEHVPAGVPLVTVAMTTPVAVALPRAAADPTRRLSRDPGWLSDRYQDWSGEVGRVAADVVLDAGELSVEQGVQRVRTAIEAARSIGR